MNHVQQAASNLFSGNPYEAAGWLPSELLAVPMIEFSRLAHVKAINDFDHSFDRLIERNSERPRGRSLGWSVGTWK